jgi:hypothetical protein
MAKAFISSEFLGGDMKVDLKHLPVLLLRLQIQLNSHGMRLDTDKFTKVVEKNNDVGHIIKMCGEMLSLDAKGNMDPQAMDMVTVDEQYSKGSVDAARGKSTKLMKPQLEHRNTVVRDVKRGLSMKGIEIEADSDSVDSDYSDGYVPVHITPAKTKVAPRRQGSLGSQGSSGSDRFGGEQKVTSSKTGKFKAAAKVSRLMGGGQKLGNERDYGQETRSAQRKDQSKAKLKSAAIMATAAGSARRPTDNLRSSRKDPRDDQSSNTAPRKARSVDKALVASLTAFRKSSSRGDDGASITSRESITSHGSGTSPQRRIRSGGDMRALASSTSRKATSQPRRRKPTDMSPGRGSISESTASQRSASSGGKLRRSTTMCEDTRRQGDGRIRRLKRQDSF